MSPSSKYYLFIFSITFVTSLVNGHYSSLNSDWFNRRTDTLNLDGDSRRIFGFIPGSGIGFKWSLSFPVTTVTRLKTNLDLAHDIPMLFAKLYPEIGNKEIKNDRMGLSANHYFDDAVHPQLASLGYGAMEKTTTLISDLGLRNVSDSSAQEVNFEMALKHNRLRSRIERKFFYADFESLFRKMGVPGKSCLLRTICEIAGAPFEDSLFGDILNTLLSPSFAGRSEYAEENPDYDDYIAAEEFGANLGDCSAKFSQCKNSLFAFIYDLIEDLL